MTTDTLEMIPVSKLVQAPENVRKTNTDAGHEGMKASILSDGILQNLIVYITDKEKFAVAGGERRRKALAALVKQRKIPKSFEVPVLVKPREEAIALSLAENVQRENMHPADEFAAFAAMIDQGKSIEDVAARFGVMPAVVTRRMKLGKVAPVILAAFREDEISLEAVMGFTVTDDHAEQAQVFADLTARGVQMQRQTVIRMLTHQKVGTDDARFIYVGEDAYVAAGGTISRDLFDTEGGGYADDSALLDRLTVEMLAAEVPAILAEGWKWIAPVAEHDDAMARGFARIHQRYQPLSGEDEARRAVISTRLDEIAEETGGDEPEDGPLAEEHAALTAELDAIESREHAFDRDEQALAGGWITLDEDGNPTAVLGYVKREDIPALDALRQRDDAAMEDEEGVETPEGDEGEDEGDGEAEGEALPPSPAPVSAAGLSDAVLTDLHAARTIALRLELAKRPDIALRAVAHALAARIMAHETGALTVSVHEVYIPAISKTHCPDDDALKSRIGHWRLRLPGKSGELWGAILALSDEDLLDLIAVCAAVSIDATHQKHGDFAFRQRMTHAGQLATTLQLDMAKHWQPTADGFFSRISKTSILDAVADAAGAKAAGRLDGLKKGVMAVEAVTAVAGTGWVPGVLRTQGLTTPEPEAEAEAA
jgi:ParB family chromosome partitioning protein